MKQGTDRLYYMTVEKKNFFGNEITVPNWKRAEEGINIGSAAKPNLEIKQIAYVPEEDKKTAGRGFNTYF